MTIWGNHSATQYPDLFHAKVDGQARATPPVDDQAWLENDFIPTVQKRGAAIIEARGVVQSAASAANAAIDHVHDWVLGTPAGRLGVDGRPVRRLATACPRASSRSFPCTSDGGEYSIVQGLEIDDFSQAHRRHRGRARRGARHRDGPRPDLIHPSPQRACHRDLAEVASVAFAVWRSAPATCRRPLAGPGDSAISPPWTGCARSCSSGSSATTRGSISSPVDSSGCPASSPCRAS